MSNSVEVQELIAKIQYELRVVAEKYYYEPNTPEIRRELQLELQAVIDLFKPSDLYLRVRVNEATGENEKVEVYFDESPVH